MKKLALFNQKGGCAKTTSVVNIAGYMAKMGRKVLVVDCDPQANATQFLLMENEPVADTIVSAISGEKDLKVPATVDKDALEGYAELIDTINMLKINGVNPDLSVLGVYLTIYNDRESFDRYMAGECAETFGDTYIDIPIRRHTYAKQSALFGRPLCWYKPTSRIANDYEALTTEIMNRMEA